MMRRTAALLALLVLVGLAAGGRVLSRLPSTRASAASRDAADGPSVGAEGAGDDDVPADFLIALERLRSGPSSAERLRAVLGYLEAVREKPRSARSRHVCLWEPDVRAHIVTANGGLDALRAAGFSSLISSVIICARQSL